MAEIVVSNRMSATYEVKGYNESAVDIEVIVGTYEYTSFDMDVAVRANKNSDVLINADIVYSGQNDILIEVIPKMHNHILMEVEVNPHNKMTAVYELIEPPTVTVKSNPIKDTFTTQNSPYNVINYGGSNSLKIGQDNNGENISYLQFDLSEVPLNSNLKSAKLKLYYSTYNEQSIEVQRIIGEWSEYGLTQKNTNFQLSPTSSSFVNNTEDRCIEIDIKELTSLWVKGALNNGLALTSDDLVNIYRTRESSQSPVLEVVYYKAGDYDFNTSKLLIDASIRVENSDEILIDANVKNDFAFSDVLISMYAHQPDIPLLSDVEMEVEVNEYESYSDVLIEASVMDDGASSVNIEVTVPVYYGDSEVLIDTIIPNVKYSEFEIEAEVLTKPAESDIELEVVVISRELTEVNIEVEINQYRDASDVLIETTIVGYENSEILIDADIKGYDAHSDILIDASVIAVEYSEVLMDMTVKSYDTQSDIIIEVDIPVRNVTNDILIEAGVLGYGDSDVLIEMYPRIPYVDHVQIEMEVVRRPKTSIYVYMIE